jgi:hypothetical protein
LDFVLGLALAWVGLVFAAITLWRQREVPVAQEPALAGAELEPSPGRWVRTAGAPVATVGAVVWLAALLALPLAHMRCDVGPHVTAPSALTGCRAIGGVYSLEAVALAPLLTLQTQKLTARQGREAEERALADVWTYLRTFLLLALTLVAMPFALMALWRRTLSRWGVLGIGLWLALAVAVTWTAVASVAVFISPPTDRATRRLERQGVRAIQRLASSSCWPLHW